MKIARDRYIKRLVARKHDGFVKIITGLRRCGKSYLLFNLFREHLLSLKLRGDFFQKIIVENGYRKPMQDSDGVWRVGVIPFLLEDDLIPGMESLGARLG